MHNKVKVLSCKGQLMGLITKTYYGPPNNCCPSTLYWVRLTNGLLLKDLTDNEIEHIPLRPGDYIEGTRHKKNYDDESIKFKGVVNIVFASPTPRAPELCTLEDGTVVYGYDDVTCLTIKE